MAKQITPHSALKHAIVLLGGQTALANAMTPHAPKRIRQSHVFTWLARRKVPADCCPALEKATKGEITMAMIRPDVYGE